MAAVDKRYGEKNHRLGSALNRIGVVFRLAPAGAIACGPDKMVRRMRGVLFSASVLCFAASTFAGATTHTAMELAQRGMCVSVTPENILNMTLLQLTNIEVVTHG